MTLEQIKSKLKTNIKDCEITMEGDGCNCSALIISPTFDGLTMLQRQKMVLGIMKDEFATGELHALSIKARTPAENLKIS
jgi:acid stress-induced BolA-like protein IbaG/YrbA